MLDCMGTPRYKDPVEKENASLRMRGGRTKRGAKDGGKSSVSIIAQKGGKVQHGES